MTNNFENNKLEDLLGKLQPESPNVSLGNVMFESGRILGTNEQKQRQRHHLLIWRCVAAASVCLTIFSIAISLDLFHSTETLSSGTADETSNSQTQTDKENTSIHQHVGSTSQSTDKTARNTSLQLLFLPKFDFDQSESGLGKRLRLLNRGINGLDEVELPGGFSSPTYSDRTQLINELLREQRLNP